MTLTVTLFPACLYNWESELTSAARLKYSSGKPWSRKHSLGVSFLILISPSSIFTCPMFAPVSMVGDVSPSSMTRPLLVLLFGNAISTTPPRLHGNATAFGRLPNFYIRHVTTPPNCVERGRNSIRAIYPVLQMRRAWINLF